MKTPHSNPYLTTCRIHSRKATSGTSLEKLTDFFSRLDSPVILGANRAKIYADGVSYWMAQPIRLFECDFGETDPLGKLRGALSKYKIEKSQNPSNENGLFLGGWAGFFSYELGRFLEPVKALSINDLQTPLIRLGFYDKVITFDHKEDEFFLSVIEINGEEISPEQKLSELENFIICADKTEPPRIAATQQNTDSQTGNSNISRKNYLDGIKTIKQQIYDGEVYQVNYSRRIEHPFTANPVDLFHWQNRYNPNGYSAFLKWDDFSVVSASPELFIRKIGNKISTKPIKGTRAHLPENEQNREVNNRLYRELAGCEKEQAELNMIIDLERNDLTRICRYGTIKVQQPRTIETYPTVYHAVATVTGQLRKNTGTVEILKGLFPGGSITGAPKISAMRTIEQLEPTTRGIYTGSIGFLGLDGAACLNIAIRTIIIRDLKAYAQTGGGIVADSDPESEWQETLVKASALLRGIKKVQENYGPKSILK